MPTDLLSAPSGTMGAIGAGVMALIGGAMWLRKTLSTQAVDVAGDRAEVNIIEILQKERDAALSRLEVSEKEKNEQFKEFMKLTVQVQLLQGQVENLTKINGELTQKIQDLQSALEKRT